MRCEPDAIEGADQIDLDDFREEVERMRSLPRDRTLGASDTGAIDRDMDRAETFHRLGDRLLDRVTTHHVRRDEESLFSQRFGDLRAWRIGQIEDRYTRTALRKFARRRLAESRPATRNNRNRIFEIHFGLAIESCFMGSGP